MKCSVLILIPYRHSKGFHDKYLSLFTCVAHVVSSLTLSDLCSLSPFLPCFSVLCLKYYDVLTVIYVLNFVSYIDKQDAQLSQRDRAAGCVIVFAKSRRVKLGDNILRTL